MAAAAVAAGGLISLALDTVRDRVLRSVEETVCLRCGVGDSPMPLLSSSSSERVPGMFPRRGIGGGTLTLLSLSGSSGRGS